MLYVCTCSTQEESNTALLENYHLHDYCLLSKWKHVTCAETPLHATTRNDKSRVEKKILFHSAHCIEVLSLSRLLQRRSSRYKFFCGKVGQEEMSVST